MENEKKEEEGQYGLVKQVSGVASQPDYVFKICLVGDANVGKTSLLTKYCDNVFKESYNNTIGVDFRCISYRYKDTLCKVQIWDTAGQERFKSITVNYFRSSHGFMFVYDITNKHSFQNAKNWMETAFANNKMNVVNFLVGNKCDLAEKREVNREEANELAEMKKLCFLETSALNSTNVEKAFEMFIHKLLDYYTSHKQYCKEDDDISAQTLSGEDIEKLLKLPKKKDNCKC
jgi:Ras-related protein Rab-1A